MVDQPPGVAAGVMAQLAMQQTMEEITDYLATIDEKVDDVLRAFIDTLEDPQRSDDAITIWRAHVQTEAVRYQDVAAEYLTWVDSEPVLRALLVESAAGLRKTRHQGLGRVGWQFTLTMAAYNLIRLPKLLAATT